MTDLARLEVSQRAHEGVRDHLYVCPANKLSIGVGRNLEDVPLTGTQLRELYDAQEITITLTQAGIKRILAWDMDTSIRMCQDFYPHWHDLNDPRQNAVTELCFQMGFSKLMKFTKFNAAVGARDWKTAKAELENARWFKQTGHERTSYIINLIETGEWP